MIGTLIGFFWTLVSVISSYQASIYSGLIFFFFAGLAALSFAFTWILGMYLATAGVIFVGAKMVASNLRINDGGGYNHRPIHHRQY